MLSYEWLKVSCKEHVPLISQAAGSGGWRRPLRRGPRLPARCTGQRHHHRRAGAAGAQLLPGGSALRCAQKECGGVACWLSIAQWASWGGWCSMPAR